MRSFSSLILLLLASSASFGAEPFRKTLISTSKNVRVPQLRLTGAKITPECPVKWSIQKRELHGGKQEGVDLLLLNNGKLTITLIPQRGMSILSVEMGKLRLGWNSPVKEIVHPKWMNLQLRGGLGWLEGFNEWMCRCGLESNGQPGEDKFINNVGDEATMNLTLHGRIGNLPAQEVEVIVEKEAPHRLRIRGRVDERSFYGPKLELWTEISTVPGSNEFQLRDVITNHGAADQEYQILYHTNFGKPLLEEGATFLAPVKRVTPFNDHAAKFVNNWTTYEGPKLGFIEQVYCLHPLADNSGRTLIMIQNKAQNQATSLRYSVKDLPYLTVWKNTAAEKDGYVTGLEPGTNFPNNRRVERKMGRVPKLAPGKSQEMTIDFAVHVGAENVKKVHKEIQQIQGSRKVTIDRKPEKKE